MLKAWKSTVAPLRGDATASFRRLRELVQANPAAHIVSEQTGYLYAEYRSPVLGFVDDVEFLLDSSAKLIHMRSASRLGRKDFGANRKRVEDLRAQLDSKESL